MRLAVDIDGTLADFNTAFAQLLIRIHPQLKKNYDVFSSSFPSTWDWYADAPQWAVDAAWTEVNNSGLFWKSLFPYATAYKDIFTLIQLRSQHDIYFVTARPGRTAKAESEEWLRSHGFNGATVIIAADKPLLCKALEIDLIIDDKPENLGAAEKNALFMRPYNTEAWHMKNLILVDSVREALGDSGVL